MKKIVYLMILAAILLTASCEQQESIKVGVSPVTSSAGIFIALERGYFKEQGLDIELTYFQESGAPMSILIANGEMDVGGGNLSSGLFAALNSGKKIKLVADKGHLEEKSSYINLIVRQDHLESGRFKKLQDLKGFKMALTSLGGASQQILADRFLKKAGLNMSDVQFFKMSYAEMNIALKEKHIDATIQLEPFVAKAELDGVAKVFAKGFSVYSDQQSAAIFYSESFASKRAEKATKFMIAYLKGVRDYHNAFIKGENKKEVIELLKKHIRIEDERIWEKMFPIGLNPNGFIRKTALQADVNWYVANGFLDKAPNVEQFVDHTFINFALEKIGRVSE